MKGNGEAKTRRVDAADAVKGAAYGNKFFVVFVEKANAQGGRCAAAAVVGGASADADYKFATTIQNGVLYHLPYAVGGGLVHLQPVAYQR